MLCLVSLFKNLHIVHGLGVRVSDIVVVAVRILIVLLFVTIILPEIVTVVFAVAVPTVDSLVTI